MKHKLAHSLCWLLFLSSLTAQDYTLQKFFPDDPLWQDDDTRNVAEPPTRLALSDYFDLFSNTFAHLGSDRWGEAANLNTVDEVPDSSWFTNRHGRSRMRISELKRGPRQNGPPADGSWTIFQSKSEGITPGFHIEDSAGRRFVIKLEQSDISELATGAEVVATQIFHAIGYWVPENYIVEFDPANFEIREGAVVSDSFGDETPLTPQKLKKLLAPIGRSREGKIRALASRYIPGSPIGPFRYHGTRSDDPNDVVPHEDRRELRALRLFAAWTNHDDTRAQNTQNTWMSAGGLQFIRHYLIDFGSTLGSGSVRVQLPFFGFHYLLDIQEIKRAAVRFGGFVPAYRKVDWPEETDLRGVGLFESKSFDPGAWKPNYPNPAFIRMTDRDAFWAARIIMRFSREELAAILQLGKYSNPRTEEYLLETLIERQKKIGREYLNRLNPLDEFVINEGQLQFKNLPELHGLANPGARYKITWSVYHNKQDSWRELESTEESTRTQFPSPISPGGLGSDEFLAANIQTSHPGHPDWSRKLVVYFRAQSQGGFELVGVEREGNQPTPQVQR